VKPFDEPSRRYLQSALPGVDTANAHSHRSEVGMKAFETYLRVSYQARDTSTSHQACCGD